MGLLSSIFGSGGSTASTAQTSQDMRVVGGNDSSNISTSATGNAQVSIVTTDHGAVKQALDFAGQTVSSTGTELQKIYQSSIESQNQLSGAAFGAVESAQKQLAQAYQNGNAGDQTTLKYAGFILVGLAIVFMFKSEK